jgi:PHD/YefM family antitoxin component YafN of YafNO toxin-antitoxin module
MQQIANIQEQTIEKAIEQYGEIVLSKNNKNQLVIMSMEEYKNNIFDEETIKSLLKSEDDIKNGRTRKGAEVVKELKTKYGF